MPHLRLLLETEEAVKHPCEVWGVHKKRTGRLKDRIFHGHARHVCIRTRDSCRRTKAPTHVRAGSSTTRQLRTTCREYPYPPTPVTSEEVMSEAMVTVRLPLGDWNQIVSDIENMCGTSAENIEILQQAEIVATEVPT